MLVKREMGLKQLNPRNSISTLTKEEQIKKGRLTAITKYVHISTKLIGSATSIRSSVMNA